MIDPRFLNDDTSDLVDELPHVLDKWAEENAMTHLITQEEADTFPPEDDYNDELDYDFSNVIEFNKKYPEKKLYVFDRSKVGKVQAPRLEDLPEGNFDGKDEDGLDFEDLYKCTPEELEKELEELKNYDIDDNSIFLVRRGDN